jgi:hypothetical protein
MAWRAGSVPIICRVTLCCELHNSPRIAAQKLCNSRNSRAMAGRSRRRRITGGEALAALYFGGNSFVAYAPYLCPEKLFLLPH